MKQCAASLVALAAVALCAAFGSAQTDLSDEALLRSFDEARLFDETTTGITVAIVAETADDTKEATTRLRFKTIDGEEAVRQLQARLCTSRRTP